MTSLNEIGNVIVFEKESIILACVIALPTGFLFELGTDIYKLSKPHIISAWKRVASRMPFKRASSGDSPSGSSGE